MTVARDRAGAGEGAFAPSLRLAPSRRWAAGFAAVAYNMALFGAFAAHFAGVDRVAAKDEGSSLKLFSPAAPAPEAAPAPQSPARAERRPVADRAAAERIDPVPPAATLKVAAGGVAAPPPVAAPMVAPPAPTVVPPPPVAPAVVEAASRDAAWAEYQRQVRARIAARRPAGLHMAGVATLRFTLDGGGRLATLDLAQGSGNAMLDRLALRTVRSASPFPPPPDGVARERLVFIIGFSFH